MSFQHKRVNIKSYKAVFMLFSVFQMYYENFLTVFNVDNKKEASVALYTKVSLPLAMEVLSNPPLEFESLLPSCLRYLCCPVSFKVSQGAM